MSFKSRAFAGAVLVGSLLGAQGAEAVTETVVHDFAGGVDGCLPEAGLIQDSNGNLWGTTTGGCNNSGTVFEFSGAGAYAVAQDLSLGTKLSEPVAGLIQDSHGNLWGTTAAGGTKHKGTVFEISPAGVYSVVHNFAIGTDGSAPNAGLVQDKNGNLWGTTVGGGTHLYGTVFEITTDGSYSVAYNFAGGSLDGSKPVAGLLQDSNGNLWGTTAHGGTRNRGTIFEITAAGAYSVVHNFGSGTDGNTPEAGLIQDNHGNLWGTTQFGGTSHIGVVFEITAAGAYSVVHNFKMGTTDGSEPMAGLIQDANGNFWGTTQYGGTNDTGTVYELTPAGAFSLIYSFGTNLGDGARPKASLIQDKQGNFWGTTRVGSLGQLGTVFKITP